MFLLKRILAAGELMLSRELKQLSATHNAQAALVGTYATSAHAVYVTAKLINTTTNLVIVSYDYSLPKGPEMDSLLRRHLQMYSYTAQ